MRIPKGRRTRAVLLALAVAAGTVGLRAQIPDLPYPDRAAIPLPYTWDLARLFPDEDSWAKERAGLEAQLADYQGLEAAAGKDGAGLLAALRFDALIQPRVDRVLLYAQLKSDTDTRSEAAASGRQLAAALGTKAQAARAYIPAILAGLSEERLARLMVEEPGLAPYRHFIDSLRRRQAHALPREQEALLAQAVDLADTTYTSYTTLTGREMVAEKVKDPQGREVDATVSAWYKSNFSPDREFRLRMREAFLRPFAARQATIASLVAADVQGYELVAKARGYGSAREASLDQYAIPLSVYDNLMACARRDTAPLQRWIALKARRLGLPELRPCDLNAPVFGLAEGGYGYEAARDAILASVKPLGTAYGKALATSFGDRSIDVADTPSKRPGCSSQGAYGIKPFVRMHYTNQFMDRVTLTHELGHQMHTALIYQAQPYAYSKYPPFKSEVTSLVHEGLLFDHLLSVAQTRPEKLRLLEAYLNNLQWMFYDAALWGAHEKAIHDLALEGKPVTAPALSESYAALWRSAYGPLVRLDGLDSVMWTANNMVFYDFYTWQYASSFAAAETIVARIKAEGPPAAEAYLAFLKAGSSGYPVDQLKAMGVDMSSADVFAAVPRRMNALLDQVERLLAER
jgi:oligoendopeptidase F